MGESLADLMARQTLRAEQVVDIAADIAKEIALMHRHGLAYGALESRNIRISGGRPSLAPMEPAVEGSAADDVRDFGVWLRGLARELPEQPGDRRRKALDDIASRYLEAQSLPVSTQMKKAAMALALLRVTGHGAAAPEAETECASVPPAPARKKVLLLMRVVHGDDAAAAEVRAPLRKAPWYAAAAIAAGLASALFYFVREIL
jgi:hypothetical protein